jgi:hypothetical protein
MGEERLMTDTSEPKRYSVSLRLRRTRVEYSYVLVPVTDDIMTTAADGCVERDEKGNAHIDVSKFVRRATEIASAEPQKWLLESESYEPHPIQKSPDPDET